MGGSKTKVTRMVLHGSVTKFPHSVGTLLLLGLQNVQLGEHHCSEKDGSLSPRNTPWPYFLSPPSCR